MVAHTRLWIDDSGKLTDAPPSRGVLVAKNGMEIPPAVAKRHGLSVIDGRVVQGGKPAATPKSTPDALIADRTLWVDADGVLSDSGPGVKLADAGEKIPRGYQVEHKLFERDGRVEQKAAKRPADKAVKAPANKGLTIKKNK